MPSVGGCIAGEVGGLEGECRLTCECCTVLAAERRGDWE